MARTFILTLALVFGALALADTFVCPDGCTEDAAVGFDCVLCHGFTAAVASSPAVPAQAIARACAPALPHQLPPVPRSIEHPPRA